MVGFITVWGGIALRNTGGMVQKCWQVGAQLDRAGQPLGQQPLQQPVEKRPATVVDGLVTDLDWAGVTGPAAAVAVCNTKRYEGRRAGGG